MDRDDAIIIVFIIFGVGFVVLLGLSRLSHRGVSSPKAQQSIQQLAIRLNLIKGEKYDLLLDDGQNQSKFTNLTFYSITAKNKSRRKSNTTVYTTSLNYRFFLNFTKCIVPYNNICQITRLSDDTTVVLN